MVSVNISIHKEAYRFLKTLKSKDASFSEVILSFKREERGIENLFGVLKDMDWEKRKNNMKVLRHSFKRRLE